MTTETTIEMTIDVAISSDGRAHQTMEDAAVSIAIEVVTTTTGMIAVVMAIDDRLLRGAVIEEVLIAMTVAEGVDHVRRSDVADATGVLTVDMMMAVLCPDEGLIRFRTYRSSHKFHQRGSSDFFLMHRF
jgi:hypothetical protein